MINIPEIVKAQRDLMGQLAITFKDDEGKEFVKAFSELRAGISWPIRGSSRVHGDPGALLRGDLRQTRFPDAPLRKGIFQTPSSS